MLHLYNLRIESDDFESAIRLAISLEGDSDTLARITGSIAEAFYGIPKWIKEESLNRLTDDLKSIVLEFEWCRRFNRLK